MFRSNKLSRIGRFKFGIVFESPSPNYTAVAIPVWSWLQTNVAGYTHGGAFSGNLTSIPNKGTYATETTATVAGAALTTKRTRSAAVGDTTIGLILGGSTTADALLSTAEKTTYGTSTTATQASANLSVAKSSIKGNAGFFTGYIYGGGTGSANLSNTVVAEKVPFSTVTSALVSSANLTAVSGLGAAMSSAFTIYTAGGFSPWGTYTVIGHKMPISTETTSAVASVNAATGSVEQGVNSELAGYIVGGPSTKTTKWQKTVFTTDTTSLINGCTTPVSTPASSPCSSTTTLYAIGGYDSNFSNKAYKVVVSVETCAAVTGMNLAVGVADPSSIG